MVNVAGRQNECLAACHLLGLYQGAPGLFTSGLEEPPHEQTARPSPFILSAQAPRSRGGLILPAGTACVVLERGLRGAV